MKRIPLMLFCVSIAVISCKKEKSKTTETETNTPGVIGSQMIGTWRADSTTCVNMSSGIVQPTTNYTDSSFYNIIEYLSDSTYKETFTEPDQSASTNFVLNESSHSFRYKNVNGVIGTDIYTVLNVDAHSMVIEYYQNTVVRYRAYHSR